MSLIPTGEDVNAEGLTLSFPITKIDRERREVWGPATTESEDQQGEVVDYEASKVAFGEWTQQFNAVTGGESLGNIREMHQPKVVGKAISYVPDDVGRKVWLGARIGTSPDGQSAWDKVLAKELTGFSIGAPKATRVTEFVNGRPRKRVVGYKLSEVSLVDNPACPEAVFTEIKLVKGMLDPMDPEAQPRGEDIEPGAPRLNAFVDANGDVWKMVGSSTKNVKGLQSHENTEADMLTKGTTPGQDRAIAEEIGKGKNVGAHTRGEGTAPDPAPKGQSIDPPNVAQGNTPTPKPANKDSANMPDASAVIPSGPHDSASSTSPEPDGQGKSATFPPQGGQPGGPPSMPPPPPQAQKPQMNPFQYCAMCAGKLADGTNPVHAECAPVAQMPPQAPPPPAQHAGPNPMQQMGPHSQQQPPGMQQAAPPPPMAPPVGPQTNYAAAAGVGELVKTFGLGLNAMHEVQKSFGAVLDENASLRKRLDTIEATPVPGGPLRTALPQGVAALEKGGAQEEPGLSKVAALEKVISETRDPFVLDKLRQELTKCAIADAQRGK